MRSLIAGAACFCVLVAAVASTPARAQVPGGPSKASVKDKGVVQAAQFAVKAQQQALEAAGKAEKLALVEILSAQQQVVQGMNYKLTLRVKAGESVKTAEAQVWVRLWLKGDEQYKLTSWKLADEEQPKPAPAEKEGPKPGGWAAASVKDKGVVQAARFAVKAQQQALEAASKAEKLVLVKIASAQQQVVQGTNYKLTLQVKAGDRVKTTEAVVWVRLWLKADERYKLTSWSFAEEEKAKPEPAKKVEARADRPETRPDVR